MKLKFFFKIFFLLFFSFSSYSNEGIDNKVKKHKEELRIMTGEIKSVNDP